MSISNLLGFTLVFGREMVAYFNTRRVGAAVYDIVGSPFYENLATAHGGNGDVFWVHLIGHLDPTPMQASTKMEFTPFQIVLAELPPAIRSSIGALVLRSYSITRDEKSVDYKILCDGLERELEQLAEGLTIEVGGRQVPVRFRLLVAVADLMAKAMIMSMSGPTGYYGCTMCLLEGVCENHRILYPDSEIGTLRTAKHFVVEYRSLRLGVPHLGFQVGSVVACKLEFVVVTLYVNTNLVSFIFSLVVPAFRPASIPRCRLPFPLTPSTRATLASERSS